jgi:hypothetical protein
MKVPAGSVSGEGLVSASKTATLSSRGSDTMSSLGRKDRNAKRYFLFIRLLIPFLTAVPHYLITSSRLYLLKLSHWGLDSNMSFGGNTETQTIEGNCYHKHDLLGSSSEVTSNSREDPSSNNQ